MTETYECPNCGEGKATLRGRCPHCGYKG